MPDFTDLDEKIALKRRIKELETLLTVVSRHASAFMELLTPEQIAACVKYPSSNGATCKRCGADKPDDMEEYCSACLAAEPDHGEEQS